MHSIFISFLILASVDVETSEASSFARVVYEAEYSFLS